MPEYSENETFNPQNWELPHPNGISYADGFRYLPDGFFFCALLGGCRLRHPVKMGAYLYKMVLVFHDYSWALFSSIDVVAVLKS